MECTIQDLYDFLYKNHINIVEEEVLVETRFGYKKILACDYTAYNSNVIRVRTEKNKIIKVSPDHLLFSHKWQKTKMLVQFDSILTKDGYEKIESIYNLDTKHDLMDLQVDEVKEFYANNIVSHNSSISEIIQYALFGKVATKTLKDIPNRINKSLEVEIELIASQRYIKICRGLEPTKFEVQVDKDIKYGDRASKLEVQKALEEEFYGIPYSIFNNIISLSVNDFKSFIKMSPNDKRNIIDKIFGLSILNKMFELLKADHKKIKEAHKSLDIKVQSLTDQIDNTTDELDRLSDKIIQDNIDRKDKLEESLAKLFDIKKRLSNDFKKLNEYESVRNKEIDGIYNEIQRNTHLIRQLNEKIELYNNDKCPTCASDLHTEFHQELLDTFILEQNAFKKLNIQLNGNLKIQKENRTKVSNKKEQIRQKLYQIDNKNNQFRSELNGIQDLSKLDNQTMSMRKLIEETQYKLDAAITYKKKAENKKKFYEIVEDILSDKGIKQMAIKSIVPSINVQVIQLMKELNLEFQLEFDDDFKAKLRHLGREISPATLSTGENKKLDFVIIIAIIKLMKMKFPGLNLLFLDEIFSSLDSDSVHHVLLILNKIASEHNLHIFVVNHAPLDNNIFDYKYETKKKNNFSYLEQEKLL